MAQSLPLTQQQTTRSTRLPTFTGSRSLSRQALAYHSSHRAHYRPCRIAASHLEREHSSLSASTNTDTKGKSKCSPLPDFNTSIRWGATLQVSPWQIPHSQKLAKGGEDTYFISQDASVFGVFDGVGGWSSRGIDPRDYSSEISRLCEEATNEQYLIDPREILQYAHLKISQKAVIGSCTACLISVTSNAMKAINLGDSGFFVLRGSDILVKSKEQQHRFNMPFQIGYQSADTPLSADTYNIALENGDLIVAASDGLFDNVYLNDLVQLISGIQTDPVQTISKAIAEEARYWGKSKEGRTPFSDNAQSNGFRYDGGKEDDITVIVARFRESGLAE